MTTNHRMRPKRPGALRAAPSATSQARNSGGENSTIDSSLISGVGVHPLPKARHGRRPASIRLSLTVGYKSPTDKKRSRRAGGTSTGRTVIATPAKLYPPSISAFRIESPGTPCKELEMRRDSGRCFTQGGRSPFEMHSIGSHGMGLDSGPCEARTTYRRTSRHMTILGAEEFEHAAGIVFAPQYDDCAHDELPASPRMSFVELFGNP